MSKRVTRIGVIADTHVRSVHELPVSLIKDIRELDMVVHLGDCETVGFIKDFGYFCDFTGVSGNHDRGELKVLLPEKIILEINGKRLGLIHGHNSFLPMGLHAGLKSSFRNDNVDAILFGHTHVIKSYFDKNILFFNPGSTAARFPALRPSYGIMTVGDSISSEIRYLDDYSCPLYRKNRLYRRYCSAASRFFVTGSGYIPAEEMLN